METTLEQEVIERLDMLEESILNLPGQVDALLVARLAGFGDNSNDASLSKKESDLIKLMRQVDSDETFLGKFLEGLNGKNVK